MPHGSSPRIVGGANGLLLGARYLFLRLLYGGWFWRGSSRRADGGACREDGRGIQLFGVHHGRDALETCQHLGLLPLLEFGELAPETVLKWGRGALEQSEPLCGWCRRHPPAVLGISCSLNETTLFETVQDSGHRRMADVHVPCEDPDGNLAEAGELLQSDQLGPGDAELVDEMPGMKVDGPDDSPKGSDHSVIER